jgi:hypothetical protein
MRRAAGEEGSMNRLFGLAGAFALWVCTLSGVANAQSLPVQVNVSGNVATAVIGDPANPLADVTLAFDGVSGLSAASLGLSARLASVADPALLARLPDAQLQQLDSAFPLLLTIEPPAHGGLRFRTVRAEIHTHALVYAEGSSYRLFKAPLNGAFKDITDEIAEGSVRARGTTGGFSQFLVLLDLRPTDSVIAEKIAALRTRVSTLPGVERPIFGQYLDDAEAAVAAADYAAALYSVDLVTQRANARAGQGLLDQWRATRNADNQAGDVIAGAATLKFSIARLRDFGP